MYSILTALLFLFLFPATASASPLCEEVTTDPLSRGYSGMTAEQILMDLRAKYRIRQIKSMSGYEISEHINNQEFIALSDSNKQLITIIAMAQEVNPHGYASRVFVHAFGGNSTTVNALADARTENISRQNELGMGIVKVGHIQECLS